MLVYFLMLFIYFKYLSILWVGNQVQLVFELTELYCVLFKLSCNMIHVIVSCLYIQKTLFSENGKPTSKKGLKKLQKEAEKQAKKAEKQSAVSSN